VAETEIIAQHLANLDSSSIPQAIIEEMKVLLFDYLGVALGGAQTESGRIAGEFSRDLRERGEATIIGSGYRVSAPSASFSNAISSHSVELDDTDSLAFLHFSPPVFSAALAMGEKQHSSGQDFLVALVAGCDILARLSAAINPSHRNRGFHTTATCGVFGAAAASAKILKLNKYEMTNALGLAGAQASGLIEVYGSSMQKRFNPGPAVRNGVVAALLAQRGFTGAETILEGKHGFLQAYSDQYERGKLLDGLGTEFPIFIEYKPYACARPIHNAIDCALQLRRDHAINPSQVNKIVVNRHPEWASFHWNKKPNSYHEAQLSLPYGVAVALVEGKAFLSEYSQEKLRDPLVQRLCERVEIQSVDGFPRGVSCKMEILTVDGEKYVSQQVDYPKGSLQNPMSIEERRAKFNSLSAELLSEQRRRAVEESISKVEKMKDISELMSLVV
jgi:2-methylcitrate dehydratase PrpD